MAKHRISQKQYIPHEQYISQERHTAHITVDRKMQNLYNRRVTEWGCNPPVDTPSEAPGPRRLWPSLGCFPFFIHFIHFTSLHSTTHHSSLHFTPLYTTPYPSRPPSTTKIADSQTHNVEFVQCLPVFAQRHPFWLNFCLAPPFITCLLYTSDAAAE